MSTPISEIKKIVDLQRSYFDTNATKQISYRIEKLKLLKKIIRNNEKILLAAIYKDFKKSEFETLTNELFLVYEELDTAIENTKYWASRKSIKTNLTNLPAKCYQVPEPYGVSLVIGAWNYPYQLSFSPCIPAIAAGNTVILKPSEIPSHTSAAMAKLINDNFDPKFFKVVEGGIPETTELLKQKFDKIFFTGSVPVGKIVYKAAAEFMTPVTLELGGKSPAIIAQDCNLKMTVKRLIWAKYLNSGQTCIAPDYVLVHDSIREDFLVEAKKEIEKSKYSFENGNYLQIINEKNFDRLTGMIDSDKIYFGGDHDRTQRYIAPTILSNVTFEDPCMQEEIFGPILPVISYSDLDEAIKSVKSLDKPLSLYLFTASNKTKNKVLKEISFGGGAINDAVMHISNPYLPFGGVGPSGIGNYHNEAGFRAFTHFKSILEKPTWIELPIKFSPYTKNKLNWIRRAMGV